MNLELSDEQQELRATVRRCLADEAPVAEQARRVADGASWTPDRAWKRLVDLGASGLLVPAEAGGSGLGTVEAAIVAEACGAALYPGPWAATAVAAVRALDAVGGGDAAAVLASIAGGTTAAVVLPPDLLGPPDGATASFDAGTVTAELDGVLGAPLATVVLVPARSGDDLVLVAVDPEADGVRVTPSPSIDPTTARGRVELDRAPARLLGPLAPSDLAAVADEVIVARAADALGAAQAVLELAVDYAKVRRQFDQPIGAFQAVQHLCVDMYETVELARSGVLHAAWAADVGDHEARRTAAWRLKAFSDRLATVADGAIQVLGGIGFTWEHDAHLFLRRLLTWSAAMGSASSYRVAIGRQLASAP